MVAVVAVVPEVDLAGVGRLLEAGLELWVRDAAAWLTRGDRLRGELASRCETAYRLLVRRPRGVPLIDLAAAMAGIEVDEVWDRLQAAVVDCG